MAVQWGIAGAGKISNDFVNALQVLPPGLHNVLAVAAASSKERAQEFATEHNIPVAYGSYEELARNQSIDCKKKNLFLMEGLWSRCFPVYKELVQQLKNRTIGDALFLEAQMGRKMEVERLQKKEMGGGTVMDLGVYVLQIAVYLFGRDPISVKAVGHLNKDGVDESMTCTITYPGGRTAVLSTHTKVELPNFAFVVGTEGTIQLMNPFWKPTKMSVNGKEKEFPLPPAKGKFNFSNSVGLSYEAEEVRRCLRAGLKESPLSLHEDSLALARLQDTVRAQLGVEFPQDKVKR